MFKREGDTHVLDEPASGAYFLRFVFLGDMPVETDGEAYARFFHNFLLGFILEKFRHVIVLLETVQTVVIDVHFPKNSVFRHFAEIAVRLFAQALNEFEHIRMRYTDGAAQTARVGEKVAIRNRHRVIEIFHQGKVKERNVRTFGQSIAILAL